MTPGWTVLAGSAAGGGHARDGVSGQDAFAVEQIRGALVLAVADGAGSARLGGVAAPLAVSLAIRVMRPLVVPERLARAAYWHRMLRVGPDNILRRFQRAATAVASVDRGLRVNDLGTTLTLVVAHPPRIGVFAVGDGIVVTRAGSGGLDLLLAPPGGARRPAGATTLLTSRRARVAARRLVAEVPDLTGVAVSSDGMDTLLIEYVDAEPVRPGAAQFDKLFTRAERTGDSDGMAVTRLLTSPAVCALTDDDKTLVVAVRR